MAVRFDVSSDRLLRTADLIDYNAAYTLMAWMRIVTDTNNYGNVYVMNDNSSGNADFFGVSADGTTFMVGRTSGGAGSFAENTGSALSLGTWYHIAMTRSGTTQTGYLNGAQDCQLTATITGRVAATRLEMGAATTDNLSLFNGRVAHAKAWAGVALTAEQIRQEMYSVLPHRFADLYAAWTLLKGATERLRDHSSNGRGWTAGGTLTDEDNPPGVAWQVKRVWQGVPVSVVEKADTDSASLAESEAVAAALSDNDTGALSEVEALEVTDTDSASLADSEAVALAEADSGSLAESETLAASVSDTDSASFVDADSVDASEQKADTETATLTESESVTAAVSDSDSAALADTESIAAQIADADSGALTDEGSVDGSEQKADSDSASLSDSEVVTVVLSDTDSTALADTEQLAAVLSDTDSAALVDNQIVDQAYTDSDTGSLSEAESTAASLSDSDLILLAEQITERAFSDSDAAVLSEAVVLSTGLPVFVGRGFHVPARATSLRVPARYTEFEVDRRARVFHVSKRATDHIVPARSQVFTVPKRQES